MTWAPSRKISTTASRVMTIVAMEPVDDVHCGKFRIVDDQQVADDFPQNRHGQPADTEGTFEETISGEGIFQ